MIRARCFTRAALAMTAFVNAACDSTGPSPVGPAIACPAAQTRQSLDGNPVAVHYPLPTVTGGAQPVSIACTPPSGSMFNVGTTSVGCSARDARQQIATCSFNVMVAEPPKLSATRFVAFGDSITAGAREACQGGTLTANPAAWRVDNLYLRARAQLIDSNSAYPTVLQAMMSERYKTQSPSVRNEGNPGECVSPASCSPDGLTRFPAVLASDTPEVLLLQEGVNDINGGRTAGMQRAIDGLRTMIGTARGRGVMVFLGTLLPERAGACRGYAPDIIPTANDQIRALAASENVDLVDLYAAFGPNAPDTYIGPDGLHPTVAGYQLMAQTFFEAIRKKLELSATTSRIH